MVSFEYTFMWSAGGAEGSTVRSGDTVKLTKLIKKAGSVTGCKEDTFQYTFG